MWDKALTYFNPTCDVLRLYDDKENLAWVLNKIGYLQVKLKMQDGILNLERSLEICKQLEN